jgi:hypothetical protein
MCDKSGRKRNAVCPENVGFDGKSEHLPGVVLLTTDQKVRGSNPFERARQIPLDSRNRPIILGFIF